MCGRAGKISSRCRISSFYHHQWAQTGKDPASLFRDSSRAPRAVDLNALRLVHGEKASLRRASKFSRQNAIKSS